MIVVKIVDVIVCLLLVLVVGVIAYFSFVKNKDNPCHNCPYGKSCNRNKCNKIIK